MENRVYHGQYSLRHWIELILKKNVLLPNYQRFFVWEVKDVVTLVQSFKNKEFIPPITIGAFTDGGLTQNYILDGQQRLTSILLAYLGIFPDKDFFKTTLEELASDNDDGLDEAPEESDFDVILEWNFKKLTEKGKSKEEILEKLIAGNYMSENFNLPDNFLDDNFLGFSYLVPQTATKEIQQKYFSTVFRNINIQGKRLLPQESRASLYFLKEDYDSFFNPAFIRAYAVKNSNIDTKADFVRYLALLSQYAINENTDGLAKGYKPKMEKYYEMYIYSVVGESTSNLFKGFTTIFPQQDFHVRLLKLNQQMNLINIPKEFLSIIDSVFIWNYILGNFQGQRG